MPKTYKDRIKIPLEGSNIDFYTKSGTHVATGYTRIVIGDRGPYIEFDEGQLLKKNFHIPEDQKYRTTDRRVYYVEARSNDESNVKLYCQCKTVAYADYKVGMMYISPFNLKTKDINELVDGFAFKIGEHVCGTPVFGEEKVKGVVVKQDAGISRDAIIVKLDNGKNVIMLESTTEKVK